MIRTEYICDFCGNVQKDDRQFWTIAVTVCASSSYTPQVARSKQSCRACAERMGLLPWTQKDEPPPATLPTIEDLIREILDRVKGD